jgi:hypothetical protein
MWLIIAIAIFYSLVWFAYELRHSIELQPRLFVSKEGIYEVECQVCDIDETLLVSDTDRIHFAKTN